MFNYIRRHRNLQLTFFTNDTAICEMELYNFRYLVDTQYNHKYQICENGYNKTKWTFTQTKIVMAKIAGNLPKRMCCSYSGTNYPEKKHEIIEAFEDNGNQSCKRQCVTSMRDQSMLSRTTNPTNMMNQNVQLKQLEMLSGGHDT